MSSSVGRLGRYVFFWASALCVFAFCGPLFLWDFGLYSFCLGFGLGFALINNNLRKKKCYKRLIILGRDEISKDKKNQLIIILKKGKED